MTVSLISASLPKTFELDGAIAEWDNLSAESASANVVPADGPPRFDILGQPRVAPAVKNAENPHDADVRVAVALGERSITVAAYFAKPARDGLGLGFVETSFIRDKEEPRAAGSPFPQGLRYLHIDKGGVELVTSDGTQRLAKARVVVSADGRSMEASLPNEVLPPLDEAPLTQMVMAVSLGREVRTDYFAPPYRWVKLDAPVHYQPEAELRERVMALVAAQGPAGGSTIRYRADDAMLMTASPTNSQLGVLQTANVLYEKKASLGNVEVGLGHLHSPYIVARKGGVLSDIALLTRTEEGYVSPKNFSLSDGVVQAIVERNDEIHILSRASSAYHALWTGAFMAAHWTVSRVDRSGKIRTWYCEQPEHGTAMMFDPGQEKPFADEKLTKFGWRVRTFEHMAPDNRARTLELTCSWDAKTKSYKSRVTYTPPLPPP